MNNLFASRTTGNVFERVHGDHFYRIGFIDNSGDFEERMGIGADFSDDFIATGVESGFLIPMVRLIGGGLMPEAEYADVIVNRSEANA